MSEAATKSDPPIDLSKLSVVVGEPSSHDAKDIDRHLSILGMKDVRIFRNMDRVRHSVHNDEADLFLCNMTGNEGDARSLFRGIRYQEVGQNPFVGMISMMGMMGESDVRTTLDSGPDDLLTLPFKRDTFVTRVNELAWHRKKFVAVSTYVGPTRRAAARADESTAAEFEVPNPVYSAGTGVPRENIRKEISKSAKMLNVRKLRSDIALIKSLVGEIMPEYENSAIDDNFTRQINLLAETIDGVNRRATRLQFDNLVGLCELAGNVTTDIRECPRPPQLRHIRAMPKLVEGFTTALTLAPEHLASA